MSVDKATVAKIASLARIKMGDEELERMVPELNGILDWVEQLGEVDVTGIEPMTAVIRVSALVAAVTGCTHRSAVVRTSAWWSLWLRWKARESRKRRNCARR